MLSSSNLLDSVRVYAYGFVGSQFHWHSSESHMSLSADVGLLGASRGGGEGC
jgi:hypothetical protein